MARENERDRRGESSRPPSSPCVSLTDSQGGDASGKSPKAKMDVAPSPSSSPISAGDGGGGCSSSSNEKALMKRTLVAQSKKIQQLTARIDGMEAERRTMAQQVWRFGMLMLARVDYCNVGWTTRVTTGGGCSIQPLAV